MKYIAFFILSVLSAACSSNSKIANIQKANSIVYVLPAEVSALLKSRMAIDSTNYYFCLSNEGDNFRINVASGNSEFYAVKSNRKVFIEGKFYPLMFQMDMQFGTTSTEDEILHEYLNDKPQSIKRSYTSHEDYFVKFKKNGVILESGYSLLQNQK